MLTISTSAVEATDAVPMPMPVVPVMVLAAETAPVRVEAPVTARVLLIFAAPTTSSATAGEAEPIPTLPLRINRHARGAAGGEVQRVGAGGPQAGIGIARNRQPRRARRAHPKRRHRPRADEVEGLACGIKLGDGFVIAMSDDARAVRR